MISRQSDRRCPWTRAEIRRARQTPLKPVLDNLGYRLEQVNNGNYLVRDLPQEIVIKDNYWVCTENGSAGNAIDFFVRFRNTSFNEAMKLLTS